VKDAAGRGEREEEAPRGGRVLQFPDRTSPVADDVAIVGLLLAGDRRAPRAAWQRFAPMVHRMLKRAFGPAYDVDDLAQEVFLLLFDRVATLREPRALRAFVITLTAYTIRRELRRKKAMQWLTFIEAPSVPVGEADHDSREAVRRLYRVLDRLGPADRTAFTLRFFEGLELVEVAEAMGTSIATTKRRLAHARNRVASHTQRDAVLTEYLSGLGPGVQP
jgi:RNA polymerase sigma-70 factor (ECF subfamily)